MKLQLVSTDNPPRAKEKPHPVKKIPGFAGEQWDGELGRWVIYRPKVRF